MRLFLISYQLIPVRANEALIAELQKSEGWWHHLDYTWLIATHETADELYSRIANHLLKSDRELIVELTPGSEYQGWLPKDGWDWIAKHLGPSGTTSPIYRTHRFGR